MAIKNILFGVVLALFALSAGILPVFAEEGEDEDIMFLGLELEKLISFVNGVLAFILFLITFVTYRREYRKRLLYVSIAFALFSVRSFLISSELFIPEISWVDPASTVLDFVILLIFFMGLLKK